MPRKIVKVTDFEYVETHPDAGGAGMEWFCPDCGERLCDAPGRWWQLRCCRDWEVETVIKGVRRDA